MEVVQHGKRCNVTNVNAFVARHRISVQQRYNLYEFPLATATIIARQTVIETGGRTWHSQECARDQPATSRAQCVSIFTSLHVNRGYEALLTRVYQQPVIFSDTEQSDTSSEDGAEPRCDSQWKTPPVQSAKAANQMPTTCFGHFDRLDIEYTPLPKTKARVVVYHDDPNAAWWNAAALRDAGISSQDFAARCRLGGAEASLEDGEVRVGSRWHDESAASSMQDADGDTDEEILPTKQRAASSRAPLVEEDTAMEYEGVQLSEPWNLLTSLQVSDDAERVPLAEDLYFAGRLASTCVILLCDGMVDAAKVLGQWSVDLVGKRNWDNMVVSYCTAPRDENDNGA
jgi:hypothetical protein